MKRSVPSIGLALTGLFFGAGCPQLRDDDFRPRSVNVGGGGTTSGAAGIAGADAAGGSVGADAGRGGSGDAGSTETPAESDGGAAGPGPVGCGLAEVTGPNGSCYFADSAESTWSEARASCQSRGVGWELVAIGDADENALVLSIAGYEAWIGATDAVSEGTWLWVDEVVPFFEVDADTGGGRFTSWAEDEPNDFDGSDCLRILTTGLWADWPCDSPLGHVCRRPRPPEEQK
jgi:Lectin C-type domain